MPAILNTETPKVAPVKSGMDDSVREELAKGLSGVLADTYELTVKSHLYHWNVVGPLFKSIHEMTEEHYQNLFEAADDLAERVRALGYRAPVSMKNGEMTLSISLPSNGLPNAHEMIADLVDSHETIAKKMRDLAIRAGEKEDVVTEDLLTERISFHEQAAWMLRALITQ